MRELSMRGREEVHWHADWMWEEWGGRQLGVRIEIEMGCSVMSWRPRKGEDIGNIQ